MSDTEITIRELLRELRITIPDDRLPSLIAAWEATLREAASVRSDATPAPVATPFDPNWSTP